MQTGFVSVQNLRAILGKAESYTLKIYELSHGQKSKPIASRVRPSPRFKMLNPLLRDPKQINPTFFSLPVFISFHRKTIDYQNRPTIRP